MAIDPVCLMEVEESTAQWTSEYKGQTYYFCAPGCKVSFEEDPEKYLSRNGAEDHNHSMHEGHSHAGDDHSMHEDHSDAASSHAASSRAADGHAAGDHSSDDHR